MHLASLNAQVVTVAGRSFVFEQAETIYTEGSRKYDVPGFTDAVQSSGWRIATVWSDPPRASRSSALIPRSKRTGRRVVSMEINASALFVAEVTRFLDAEVPFPDQKDKDHD
jgi:hypothetical protein